MTLPARLRLWPTAKELARMARHPAAYAPTAAEVLTPASVAPPQVPMGADEQALMNAIIANPDADEPRLQYAEWVEAKDSERAAFIRNQLSDREPSETRVTQVPRPEWCAPFLPFGARDIVFRRGFAEAMSLTGRAFVSISDGLFAATPLRDVRLIAVNFLMAELSACPHLSRLTRLDLRGNRIGDQGSAILAGSPWLGGLKELNLTDNDITDVGMAALAATEWLRKVKVIV